MFGRLPDLPHRLVHRLGFEWRERMPSARTRRYRRFCIVTPGRAGSQMLVQRCNSHPAICCYGEIMGQDWIDWEIGNRPAMTRSALRSRDRDPMRFLERHVWHTYPAAIGAVGMKLVYSHILYRRAQLSELFEPGSGISILWLERVNIMQMCLSRIVARNMNLYSADAGEPVPIPQPIMVDVERFERSLKMLEAAQDSIADVLARTRKLHLAYEELVEQPESCNSAICGFLGVKDRPLEHSSRKLAQGPLRSRVANYDQLERHFRGTRWERHFNDA